MLPLFPLQMVVFPSEFVPLHIFEERYQQLIADCEKDNTTFGIPAFINDTVEYGTEVSIFEVVQSYPNGASDVICKGERVFKVSDFQDEMSPKLYAGGNVTFLDRDDTMDTTKQTIVMRLVEEFYDALEMPMPNIRESTFNSYTLTHKLGLSLDEEYFLLKITSEKLRLEYLIEHLAQTIPIVKNVTRTKHLIEMNGHFKNFDPLDFKGMTLK